jgi:hypothetical protein
MLKELLHALEQITGILAKVALLLLGLILACLCLVAAYIRLKYGEVTEDRVQDAIQVIDTIGLFTLWLVLLLLVRIALHVVVWAVGA